MDRKQSRSSNGSVRAKLSESLGISAQTHSLSESVTEVELNVGASISTWDRLSERVGRFYPFECTNTLLRVCFLCVDGMNQK